MEEVKRILVKNPHLDVNWRNRRDGWTALCVACERGYDAIVSILLAHYAIDVNLKGDYRYTPFMRACKFGMAACVREMLKDSRVKVNETNEFGRTSVWWAAHNNHLDTIKWWIASGREMDLGTHLFAIVVATKKGNTEVATLLETFKSDASKTRHAMRVEIGWYNGAAAEMFALVVFVSDGLLQVKDTTTTAARFFSIAGILPLELQMVLCHRLVGSTKEIIQGKDSEVAFKSLAEALLWSSIFTG